MASKTTRTSGGSINEGLATDIEMLTKQVKWREIPQAMACIEEWLPQLQSMPLTGELRKNAISLLAYAAWGIDYDSRFFDTVKAAVARFTAELSKDLTRGELGRLAIAGGLIEFHQEHYSEAEAHFENARDYADQAEDHELMIVSRYYKGRTLAKQRLYDRALELIEDAIERDLQWNSNDARVAAIELVQSWLLFLQGRVGEGRVVLERSRERLGSPKDHAVDRGNIVAALGRYHLQAGEYKDALNCFSEAIVIYEDHDPSFRNIPRAHINKAFTLRLLARDLGDLPPKKDERGFVDQADRTERIQKVEELQSQAFLALDRAAEIYAFDQGRDMHFHELSKLYSIRALLHFDRGKFREAESEAQKALQTAEKGHDNVGRANALTILSKLALDADITGFVDARRALEYARQAIGYAEKTENRRARARAYMHAARALTQSPYNDAIEADRHLKKAQEYLVAEDRDYLRDSITALQTVIEQCARRRHSLRITSVTVGHLDESIAEGLCLNEIASEQEQELTRWVHKNLGRSLNGTRRILRTSIKKVREAIGFYEVNDKGLEKLASQGISKDILVNLATLKQRRVQGQARFERLINQTLKKRQPQRLMESIVDAFECSD